MIVVEEIVTEAHLLIAAQTGIEVRRIPIVVVIGISAVIGVVVNNFTSHCAPNRVIIIFYNVGYSKLNPCQSFHSFSTDTDNQGAAIEYCILLLGKTFAHALI